MNVRKQNCNLNDNNQIIKFINSLLVILCYTKRQMCLTVCLFQLETGLSHTYSKINCSSYFNNAVVFILRKVKIKNFSKSHHITCTRAQVHIKVFFFNKNNRLKIQRLHQLM